MWNVYKVRNEEYVYKMWKQPYIALIILIYVGKEITQQSRMHTHSNTINTQGKGRQTPMSK